LAEGVEVLPPEVTFMRPVTQGIADHFAAGGILSLLDGLAEGSDHFLRQGDADLFDGGHNVNPW
jgi:hypothetical protein